MCGYPTNPEEVVQLEIFATSRNSKNQQTSNTYIKLIFATSLIKIKTLQEWQQKKEISKKFYPKKGQLTRSCVYDLGRISMI